LRETRFWKEAGCSHVTLSTNFNRRIPGRTMGDHLTALRRYHAAVADLLQTSRDRGFESPSSASDFVSHQVV
jgi:hypothetical protein